MNDNKEMLQQGLDAYNAKVAKATAKFPERPHMDAKQRIYTPLDIEGFNYLEKDGFPGQYPFTRGVQPTMYRGRLWTMRAYAGFATAEETNARYKYLLQAGQTGLSVAMDLPTQIGLDSDAELSHGEVGKVGVAIDSLADMEQLFDGIPLDKVSTSMTINGPAAVLLAMYVAVAEKQGVKPEQLRGTIQNDILKEYIARGTYIFPPRPSMRLITNTFEYCSKYIPKWNTISVGAYHIREAGSSEVQEIAFAFANAIAYIDAAIKAGQKVDDFAPGISWIFTAGLDFFFEIAKFRAARRLWARIMKERYGATVPKAQMLRVHVHTAGSVLTAQQPLNNVARITWQAMSAVLGGIQSMACCAYDEALSLPTEESATLALRTQQLIAYESGVADTIDPLAGSYYVEALTNKIEKEAEEYIKKIDEMGGAVAAIEQGYMQREMAAHAYEDLTAIETGKKTVIGVNKYADNKGAAEGESLKADLSVGERQIKRVNDMKAKRDQAAVDKALAELKEACNGEENLMPYLIAAVKTYATLGEICGVMREVFGEYKQDGSAF
ncbi:MAG: methylmalonyl-CoA mutase [Acidaminococcaceae bacterium]|nr:methylmalonyl-CoA mutase [Acidaminococcaceae bacterium]MBO6182586.1 methylmalonyl-CoA mutase [Acidaminococcaceae bacterium]MBP3264246.1 methylmalonyl-CoA mutase [Acidaminococcaceae bacterium]MBQ5344502.1 methylmalonyl-CoA mutase [Acidaminococcaceae bacterium]